MLGGRRGRPGPRHVRTGGRKARQQAVSAARRTLARVLRRARRLAAAGGLDQHALLLRLRGDGPHTLLRDVVWYDLGVRSGLARNDPAAAPLCAAASQATTSRAEYETLARRLLGGPGLPRYRGHVHPLAWHVWYTARKTRNGTPVVVVDHPGAPCTGAQWDRVRPGFMPLLRHGLLSCSEIGFDSSPPKGT